MSDINVTVQDEIVNIDVIDEPVLVNVVNSPGQQGPAGPGVPVGGTAGQILAKASATNYDTEWINNYAKYLATNVRNQTGSTIGAFQVVYISGATGNKPLISLADADTEATSSKTYGVTATAIANNGTGDVVTAGELSGINTSAFNEGDLLWLSTTAGGVVTSPPAEPAHAVFIGYVVRSHPTLGTIDVSIQNGYELNELHGVQITTPTDNQGLFYNATSTLWENKSITTALGYTPVPTTRNITINGVTYDLSADRTWTIAAGISGSGASGQVTYWTGASAVSGSNNLFWDDANVRLGIGTNAPAFELEISKSTGATAFGAVGLRITNTSGTGEAFITIRNQSFYAGFELFGDNYGVAGLRNTALFTTQSGVTYLGFATLGNAPIGFRTNTTSGTTNERLTILGNGNVAVNSTSDLGVRFGVVGDTLLRGSGNTSATTALTVQNSSSTNLFVVRNDGNVGIGTNAPQNQLHISNSAVLVNTTVRLSVHPNHANIITFNNSDGTQQGGFLATGSGFVYGTYVSNQVNLTGNAGGIGLRVQNTTGSHISFYGGNASGDFGTKFFQMTGSTGNFILQNGGSFTDGGQRLQVIGDTLLRGSGATSATTALTVQNSSSTNLLNILNDGKVGIGTNAPSSLVHAFASSGAATSGFMAQNNGTGASDLAAYSLQNQTQLSRIFLTTAAYTNVPMIGANGLAIYANGASGITFWNDNASGSIKFGVGSATAAGSQKVTIKAGGQVRFHPLSSAPASPEAGDVYYDSTLNKLRVYTTAWETITSI